MAKQCDVKATNNIDNHRNKDVASRNFLLIQRSLHKCRGSRGSLGNLGTVVSFEAMTTWLASTNRSNAKHQLESSGWPLERESNAFRKVDLTFVWPALSVETKVRFVT